MLRDRRWSGVLKTLQMEGERDGEREMTLRWKGLGMMITRD